MPVDDNFGQEHPSEKTDQAVDKVEIYRIIGKTIKAIVAISTLLDRFVRDHPNWIVEQLVFGGKIGSLHSTKFFFNEINEQYKASISLFNLSVLWNIFLVLFCWSLYFVLPPSDKVTAPILGIPISRASLITTAPIAILILLLFTATSLMRVAALRVAILKIITEFTRKEEQAEDFGDTTDLCLHGFVATYLATFLAFNFVHRSRLRVYYWLLTSVLLAMVLSPVLTYLITIFILVSQGWFFAAYIYAILLFFAMVIIFILLVTTFLLYLNSRLIQLNLTERTPREG